MRQLNPEVVHFFAKQNFVILSTIDPRGRPHSACKGIAKISEGTLYLLDLYHGQTWVNLKRNPQASVTAIDEHSFKGYCLKGSARIMTEAEMDAESIKAWEDRVTSRITQRMLRNIQEKKGHPRHPEALLPQPKYMVALRVEQIIDLTPSHLK